MQRRPDKRSACGLHSFHLNLDPAAIRRIVCWKTELLTLWHVQHIVSGLLSKIFPSTGEKASRRKMLAAVLVCFYKLLKKNPENIYIQAVCTLKLSAKIRSLSHSCTLQICCVFFSDTNNMKYL